MNDMPALFIEFNPVTWEMIRVYFKASTDKEVEALSAILAEGVKYERPERTRHDS